MSESTALSERLRALRQSGNPALSALWIEALPPEEALLELQDREGTLFRLQESHRLLELGRPAAASTLLRALGQPPAAAGLEKIRLALAATAEIAMETTATPLGFGPLGGTLPAAEAALLEWLQRVRGWRRNLQV